MAGKPLFEYAPSLSWLGPSQDRYLDQNKTKDAVNGTFYDTLIGAW